MVYLNVLLKKEDGSIFMVESSTEDVAVLIPNQDGYTVIETFNPIATQVAALIMSLNRKDSEHFTVDYFADELAKTIVIAKGRHPNAFPDDIEKLTSELTLMLNEAVDCINTSNRAYHHYAFTTNYINKQV